jgi:hypothetical protein
MSKNSGRQTESALQRQAMNSQGVANTAITKADTPDLMEERRRGYVNRILDWMRARAAPRTYAASRVGRRWRSTPTRSA